MVKHIIIQLMVAVVMINGLVSIVNKNLKKTRGYVYTASEVLSYKKSVDYAKIKFKSADPKKLKEMKKEHDEYGNEDYIISLSDDQPSSKDVKKQTDMNILMAKNDYDDLSETYLKKHKGEKITHDISLYDSLVDGAGGSKEKVRKDFEKKAIRELKRTPSLYALFARNHYSISKKEYLKVTESVDGKLFKVPYNKLSSSEKKELYVWAPDIALDQFAKNPEFRKASFLDLFQ